MAPSGLSTPAQPSLPSVEIPHSTKMPTAFNVDDFLFSKLYKSVNVEGKRTINEVLQVIFRQRLGGNASKYTVHQLFIETNRSKKQMSNVISKLDIKLLDENLLTVEFDVTCGIRILQKVFLEECKKLSRHCLAQIRMLRELRNSLSHNYPLVYHQSQPHDEKLNNLCEKNEDLDILLNEIRRLEEEKNRIEDVKELNETTECINEKKKEIYVITEIEKLRIILNDILENIGTVFEEDLTRCKSKIDQNLIDISRAKVQQYDQDTYDEEIERFKRDPMHELITKARVELKHQYEKLRVANPCPWIIWDQAEKSSVACFYIDQIYTPLKIAGPNTEILTEELLMTSKNIGNKTMVPPALVVSGLAGSGKSSLCLYFLHHWAQETQEIKGLKDYNLVIFVEMRTMRSNTLEEYLKTQRMKKSTGGISSDDLVQRLDELKLLFIIDGYDEVKKSSQKMVEDIFAKFPEQRILVTTRGEFCKEVKSIATNHRVEYLTAEICGFDRSMIKEFTDKVFKVINQSSYYLQSQNCNARACAEFLSYIEKRAKILEKLLELPLTLALMIFLWIDCPETLNRVTTCTSLYYELFCLYQKKLKDRLEGPCSDKTIQDLLLFIGKKAWQLLIDEETVLSKEDEKDIEEQCRNEIVDKDELMSAFLVYESDESVPECKYDYSFMHKTQMEYLCAYFLAEKTKEGSLDSALESFTGSGFHQVLLFLVGHFARKKTMKSNLDKIFVLLEKVHIEKEDFNFWWRLFTESLNNKPLLWKICHTLPRQRWKLSQNNVVCGLELLIAAPTTIKELVIEIENSIDPYDIKDLLRIMQSLKVQITDRYHKQNPLFTYLFFWRHFEAKCNKPSDKLLRTLYPWGYLRHFTGSVGEQPENKEVLNYCHKANNLRIRVDSCGALVCLTNSLKRIGHNVRHLRLKLILNPEQCDANTLVCLIGKKFKGHLELTLPNISDENKTWLVQVVANLCGE